MTKLQEILADPLVKGKGRTLAITEALRSGAGRVADLLQHAEGTNDAGKAACLEALEHLTREKPAAAGEDTFLFAVKHLSSSSPTVKREAARLIANTAQHHPSRLEEAATALLRNAGHEGTVVRWAAALALSEILGQGYSLNSNLVPKVKKIMASEEKNSIRKIYEKALKGQ